ncbi:Clavaminate synthase-like protein [Coniochaeta hoffmannii]|uniref:Clavaminate synthase-like protein n=1 Tax=Coniochaeta hoffmannii TaxID=91930 RepID=A0AA38VGF2_9PEZI|nr:Clavaminate synthase-like protein [Coniochaeta hoffmannii]
MSVTFKPAPYAPSVNLPAPYPQTTTFPLSLTPSQADSSIEDLLAAARDLSETGQLSNILAKNGAIYFQNLGLKDAHEFSKFAHAFGWLPHEDIGNPVRRTILAKNVATANEGPNTQPVFPHNEFGLSPHYPAYVFFYCVSAPESGGETPINNSVILYKQLKERHPDFIEELEKKGVKYQLFHPNGPRDQVASAGTTVLQAYGHRVLDTDDTETARAKIEKEIRRLPTAEWVWENQSEENPLGDLRVWQHLPAVRNHPRTGQPAFFNNIVSRYLNAKKAGTLHPPHLTDEGRYQPPAFYGDGSLIPSEYFETAVEIIYATRSLVTWKAGDVILLDNHAVQHAREPWTGNRKLLASLWDEPTAAH